MTHTTFKHNRPLKILFIESDLSTRTIMMGMTRMLQGIRTEVLAAEDGDKGLEVYRREYPDIVFTNLMHPGLSTDKAIQVMRQLNPYVFITVCSTLEFVKDVRGHNLFLVKPFTFREFLRAFQIAFEHVENVSRLSGAYQCQTA
jgi:CheY-like chemotaxis protein